MKSDAISSICIGEEVTSLDSRPKGPARIPLQALRRHLCILGTTGSGKSNCAKVICRELDVLGVPVVVFDRTGEYAEAFAAIEGVKILAPGANLVTPIFKLAEKPARDDILSQIEDWVSLLDHFNHVSNSAGLSPLQARILREALWQHYQGTAETLTIMCASRPSLVSPNVVANSNTVISFMLNNMLDIEAVAGYFVGGTRDDHVREMLRQLPVGVAVVQLNHPEPRPPARCKVRDFDERASVLEERRPAESPGAPVVHLGQQ